MKVISGFLKGRNISGYNIPGTRPTQDRVKESTLAAIQNNIKAAKVLDLFAGSGQLGIEAISNGAMECYFIDNNKEVVEILKRNIRDLDIASKCKVILSDYKRMLNEFGENKEKFDIIFVDPPYDYDVYEKVIDKINNYDLLNPNGVLILEYSNNKFNYEYGNLKLYRTKKYGYKYVSIYKNIL